MAISPRGFSKLALANLVAMVLIIATGAAVRLTGSGLGCPDWPNCFGHHLTAPLGQVHAVIEDANRMVTVLLVVLLGVTVLAAGFGSQRGYGRSQSSFNFADTRFDAVSPVNMDDIEVPAFLRYRG